MMIRNRAWRRQQRDKYIRRRMGHYPAERRLPGEVRLWQCHTPDGFAINLFHRQQRFGQWVQLDPDGTVTPDVPAQPIQWPAAEPKVVQEPWDHEKGCPRRGRYEEWVTREVAAMIGEHHHVAGVAIWSYGGSERVLVFKEPHLTECRCQSGSPHWGWPRPPAGYVWKVVRTYTPDVRDYAEGRLSKTPKPSDWPGDRDKHGFRPKGRANKRWKMEAGRSRKVYRARKLGFDYEGPRNWREWVESPDD